MRVLSFDVGVKNMSYCECIVSCHDIPPDETLDEADSPHKKKKKRSSKKNLRGMDVDIDEWGILDTSGSCNVKKMSIEQNVQNLIQSLRLEFAYGREGCKRKIPDIVVIEQQPAGNSFVRNSRMKILSHVLQAFFVLAGIQTVTFISPKNKNKLYTFSAEGKKYKYAENKHKSIQSCRHYMNYYLSMPNKWTETFENAKKKDDLADSFLQLLVFCCKHFKIDPSRVVSRCERDN